MRAEHIYPIIGALPEEEVERLYAMLGVRRAEVTGPPIRKLPNGVNGPQITENLLASLERSRQKRKAPPKRDPNK